LYDEPVSLIMNVESKKLGKKDILKIEGRHLDPDEVKEKIREVAPQATINLIENAEVVRKVRLAEL
jgi:aspartate carbamoyltransferase regulatory subunit